MELLFGTIAASQKASFEAAANFTDSCLGVVERLTQLNIDVTRATVEKSSEIALLVCESRLLQANVSGWNAALQSGIDHVSAYCQSVQELRPETARQ